MNQFKQVTEFHKKYQLEVNPNNVQLQHARITHMQEELNEYMYSVNINDREGQLDALIDLVYVAMGTAYFEGFDFDAAFQEVHRCNMKKIRKSTDRSKWDVVKPEGWTPPNIKEYT